MKKLKYISYKISQTALGFVAVLLVHAAVLYGLIRGGIIDGEGWGDLVMIIQLIILAPITLVLGLYVWFMGRKSDYTKDYLYYGLGIAGALLFAFFNQGFESYLDLILGFF